MKIILFFSILWSFSICDSFDEYKGQKYYQYYLAPTLGYDGIKFSKQYTSKQWDEILKDTKSFQRYFECQKCEVDNEIIGNIRAFAKFYAKDMPAIPICN